MKLATLLLACLLTAACQPGPPLTPLIAAVRMGDTDTIAALVKSGADVNQRGGVNNWTPLMHAVHKKQPAAVLGLLASGADVNATAGARGRDTALRLAEIEKYSDVAAMLREHGARPTASKPGSRHASACGQAPPHAILLRSASSTIRMADHRPLHLRRRPGAIHHFRQ